MLRPHTLRTMIVVGALALATCGTAVAQPPALPPQEEANLVVSRFLIAAALGDRTIACSLFPSYRACRRPAPLRGPAEFRTTKILLSRPKSALVTVVVGGSTGRFELERSGGRFVITRTSLPTTPRADTTTAARAAASLVVSRFLVAAALGEARTACALYPSYLPCTQHAPVVGSAAFALIDVTLADPGRPAVFVNIDSFRGYFVLERHGRSFVITSAALD